MVSRRRRWLEEEERKVASRAEENEVKNRRMQERKLAFQTKEVMENMREQERSRSLLGKRKAGILLEGPPSKKRRMDKDDQESCWPLLLSGSKVEKQEVAQESDCWPLVPYTSTPTLRLSFLSTSCSLPLLLGGGSVEQPTFPRRKMEMSTILKMTSCCKRKSDYLEEGDRVTKKMRTEIVPHVEEEQGDAIKPLMLTYLWPMATIPSPQVDEEESLHNSPILEFAKCCMFDQ